MPRRVVIGRVLGVALAAAAFFGFGLAAVHFARPRSSFELANELAARGEHALRERLDAVYGAGAIEVAVFLELDDAERELVRDELDPSTAVPQQRADGMTTYESSRVRERLEERSPRVRACRATLCAAPQLALPEGAALRAPTEEEREQLASELSAIARACLPLCSPPEDARPAFELVLRAKPIDANALASAAEPSLLTWPLLFGSLLLCGVAIAALRRQRQRARLRREEAAVLRGLERARRVAANHPARAARLIERWCTPAPGTDISDRQSSAARDARCAALLLTELGGGITAAVLAATSPETARRIARLLADEPARLALDELEFLAERFADELAAEERRRELHAPAFASLADAVLDRDESRAMHTELARAAARRRTYAILSALSPAQIEARLRAMSNEDADATLAALPRELAARALSTLDAAERAAWLERLSRAPELAELEREARLERLASAHETPTPHESSLRAAARAARVLARWPHAERSAALHELGARAPELASRVREQLVVFEDLAQLGAEELRTLLGCLELGELALALRGAPAEVEAAIERALSPRVRERLREERSSAGEPASQDVCRARAHLVAELRELFERGSVELSGAPTSEASAP
ncbi:MAG: hypothetical protein JNM84_21300 [Planctomycetes bacterium]|nr:hypothetical protein [Planctomycetota bacterium]